MGYLLAMQKVVGWNPISRFQEGLQMVCFSSPPVGWFFGTELAPGSGKPVDWRSSNVGVSREFCCEPHPKRFGSPIPCSRK